MPQASTSCREARITEARVKWGEIAALPEFSRLKSTPQSSVWHGEGSVWVHTVMVTDAMHAELSRAGIPEGSAEWTACMSAAICHDLGKGVTTRWSEEKEDWVTERHGEAGERMVRSLFHDEEIRLRESVCYMVRQHMVLHHVYGAPEKADMKMERLSHGAVPLRWMIMMYTADSIGSVNSEDEGYVRSMAERMTADAERLGCLDEPYRGVPKSELIRRFIGYKGYTDGNGDGFSVYIMCGFPGSGKSTYCGMYMNNLPAVSRDAIRGELGIGGATPDNGKKTVGSKDEEARVSSVFDAEVEKHCKGRESFVIDNTSLRLCYRRDYLTKIMRYSPKVKIVYVEAPDIIGDCVERRKGEIAEGVYGRMMDGFDFPQLFECDELVVVKQKEDAPDETYVFGGSMLADYGI